jgi:probable HAF family extracellular repeat protein
VSSGFVWEKGTWRPLPTLAGRPVVPADLNDAGTVCGYVDLEGVDRRHACVIQDGTVRDLGTLGGRESRAVAINGAGLVAGFSETAVPGATPDGKPFNHAFLWDGTKLRDLGTLGGGRGHTVARGLNASGTVVGTATDADGRPVAAFWEEAYGWVDLNTLVPEEAGWRLEAATGVSDAGWIVGTGAREGRPRAFLLTPVDPTAETDGAEEADPPADEAAGDGGASAGECGGRA